MAYQQNYQTWVSHSTIYNSLEDATFYPVVLEQGHAPVFRVWHPPLLEEDEKDECHGPKKGANFKRKLHPFPVPVINFRGQSCWFSGEYILGGSSHDS